MVVYRFQEAVLGEAAGFVLASTARRKFTRSWWKNHYDLPLVLAATREKLTFRYQGREFRLTDVHGKVVREVLA